MFPADLLTNLSELRRFRHVAMHAYDDFEPGRATIPDEATRSYLAGIDASLARFRAVLDPQT